MSALRDVRSDGFEHAAGSEPVTIFLHGYGSHEHDLAGLATALPVHGPWASLRAPLVLPSGGAAWVPITTPGNPDPGPLAEATDAVWEWIDEHVSPTSSVAAIGFSQGGLMASQLVRTQPVRVAATVILGGFVQQAEQPGDAALAAHRPPVFWGRGTDDRVIAEHAIARTAEWLPAHSSLVERVYPGLAHGISAEELADVRAFLDDATATPAR